MGIEIGSSLDVHLFPPICDCWYCLIVGQHRTNQSLNILHWVLSREASRINLEWMWLQSLSSNEKSSKRRMVSFAFSFSFSARFYSEIDTFDSFHRLQHWDLALRSDSSLDSNPFELFRSCWRQIASVRKWRRLDHATAERTLSIMCHQTPLQAS